MRSVLVAGLLVSALSVGCANDRDAAAPETTSTMTSEAAPCGLVSEALAALAEAPLITAGSGNAADLMEDLESRLVAVRDFYRSLARVHLTDELDARVEALGQVLDPETGTGGPTFGHEDLRTDLESWLSETC